VPYRIPAEVLLFNRVGKWLELVRHKKDENMVYKALETTLTLTPDGRLALLPEDLPAQTARVRVTILEEANDRELSELGDYHDRLADYENQLARGEIQWQ
jgi:hypothetical protein